ncbi:hypothetical protein AN161_10705 [Lysinibacillus sp. FJAT-14222]|nr:hypothetical protein AN161_10705 [Lysinibacillus sp. FJAT-14222]
MLATPSEAVIYIGEQNVHGYMSILYILISAFIDGTPTTKKYLKESFQFHVYSSIFAYVPCYRGAYTVDEKGGGERL